MFHSIAKTGWIMIKIDLNKAFDSICWPYLLNILHLLKFPSQWINLIKTYLQNTTYYPIISGTKRKPFSPSRGIKQGDPLSPYLFVIAMEMLTHINNTEISNKIWNPFKFRGSNLSFSHLFVDDIILFAKANKKVASPLITL